jgi:hypothetical protein
LVTASAPNKAAEGFSKPPFRRPLACHPPEVNSTPTMVAPFVVLIMFSSLVPLLTA